MPQHLVDLKRTAGEQDTILTNREEDFFPLSLHVSDAEVEKLGIGDLDVGDMRILEARVKVTSKSVAEDDTSGRTQHLTLTLVEGAVGPEPDKENRVAERMFGGG